MKNPYIFLPVLFLFAVQLFADNQNTKPSMADAVITDKIKSRILMDPSISVFKIEVNSENGLVSLTGTVNSDADAEILIELAQSIEDVKDINASKLKIRNGKQSLPDTIITAKVKGILIREKLMGRDVPHISINVETTKGIVYLSGTMQTQQQVDAAVNLAKSITGVQQVESQIKITGA